MQRTGSLELGGPPVSGEEAKLCRRGGARQPAADAGPASPTA